MFWARYNDFQVTDWLGLLPWLSTQWSRRYAPDFLIEHAVERMFGTLPYLKGVKIAEIGPTVKPVGFSSIKIVA